MAKSAADLLEATERWAGMRRLFANGGFTAGFAIIAAITLCAVFADLIAPHDPLFADPMQRYRPPFSQGRWLGTDELGRDILSRLVFGARLALLIAVVPTAISLAVGGAIGLISGYVGGVLDAALMRAFDVMFAFPGILLALAIGATLGPGIESMIIAMVVVTVPTFGRVVRGGVLAIKEEVFVEAARALGYGRTRIMLRHIAPNVLGALIVYGTLQTGRNVILAASLSFLGLGPQPPTPDWGQMLSSGRTAIAIAPHVSTMPGLAIVLLAIGFNMIGDGARDLLDPRLRREQD
ncbi:MAG: ABC transporter permease [Alphaproteobacteria bacterium]|nr:ABC transporter permease [Alphaproteobacteria bacterium]